MNGKIILYMACLCIFIAKSAFSSPVIIHHAARAGDVIQLEKLIKDEEIPVDSTYASEAGESEDKTPLMLAAEYGHIQAVKLLLDLGADVNTTDKFTWQNVLCFAAMNGNPEIIQLLLQKKAVNSNENDPKMSPLMYAAKGGHLEAAKLLIDYVTDEHTPSIDATNQWGDTALMYAVASGNTALVELILTKKPKVNMAEPTFSRTAYLIAAEGGRPAMMRMLLNGGADTSHKDNFNTTALIYAANSNNIDAITMALEHEKNINAQNVFGWTALSRAVTLGNLQAVQLLLDRGADIHIKDKKGRTPLTVAMQKKHTKIVALLKKAGAK